MTGGQIIFSSSEYDAYSLFIQWLGRIAFALAIAIVLHLWQRETTNDSSNNGGKRLSQEEEMPTTTNNSLRSKMLNKIENNSSIQNNKEIDDNDNNISKKNKSSHLVNAAEKKTEEENQDDPDKKAITEGVRGADTSKMKNSSTISSPEQQVNDDDDNNDQQIQNSVVVVDDDTNRDSSAQSSVMQQQQQQRSPIRAKDSSHPGLKGFKSWYEVQASLYRIYTIGRTDDTIQIHPPFIPKSERGHVPIKLRIINNYRQTISVFWINFGGKEIHKGDIQHGSTFHQTTWIGHPWVFREKDTGNLLCYYIPYRVIPTTQEVPTVDDVDEPDVGLHRFTIVSLGQRQVDDEGAICYIYDPVFPTFMKNTQDCAAWTFQELSRTMNDSSLDTLTTYLTNIVMNPSETKYRQIRIANRRFSEEIWLTPARGLLLAAGFVEQGAYAELGSSSTLPRDRVQEVSSLLFYFERWRTMQENSAVRQQPKGADGYGRANFGRPGF